MKKTVILTFAALFICLTAFADYVGYTNKGIEQIANPVLNRILTGIKENNYKIYSSDFSDTVKNAVTPKKFTADNEQIEKALGSYLSREYLGYLCVNNMNVVLWKAHFSKTSNDVLVKLVLSRIDGKVAVMGLFFE